MCPKRIIPPLPGLLALTILLIAPGCATRYRGLDSGGSGYFDYRLTEDVFSVSFRGNTSTSEGVADLYLLRRAAEVALKHEFTYFTVLTEKGRTRSGSWGYSSFKIPLIAPGAAVQIECFKVRPPDDVFILDALQFLQFNFPDEYGEAK